MAAEARTAHHWGQMHLEAPVRNSPGQVQPLGLSFRKISQARETISATGPTGRVKTSSAVDLVSGFEPSHQPLARPVLSRPTLSSCLEAA